MVERQQRKQSCRLCLRIRTAANLTCTGMIRGCLHFERMKDVERQQKDNTTQKSELAMVSLSHCLGAGMSQQYEPFYRTRCHQLTRCCRRLHGVSYDCSDRHNQLFDALPSPTISRGPLQHVSQVGPRVKQGEQRGEDLLGEQCRCRCTGG